MDKLTEAREIIGQADKEIAALFEKRMQAVRTVAEYKRENGLPVFDSAREEQLLKKKQNANSQKIKDLKNKIEARS